MGLNEDEIGAIFKEHSFKPIGGDVLLIGRQTISFSPKEAMAFLESYKIKSCLNLKELEVDINTINRKTTISEFSISDRSLFKMLGVKSVRALDHSNYEGAEIIHDLTKPLPLELYNIADFIVDGSTLDNTFDPALTIRNYGKLLRPGGRILLVNMLSNHHEPYNLLPPLWYLDYFVLNKYQDCKVYILVYLPEKNFATNVFCINLEYLMNNTLIYGFVSPYEMRVVVFAEKSPYSTSDQFPIQQHYRPESQWKIYKEYLSQIKCHQRPHLVRSRAPISFLDCKAGHLFITNNFEAVDPMEEFHHHRNQCKQNKRNFFYGLKDFFVKSKKIKR